MTRHPVRGTARLFRLTLEAWIGLVLFDVTRSSGFAPVCAWPKVRRTADARNAATCEEIVWSVEEACVWYVKRAACLQRSAVTMWLLRRHGVAAALVIGCRPLPFESHAWVEVDGRVVNDLPQYQRTFTVLARL